MNKRKYTHMNEYEAIILTMRQSGYTDVVSMRYKDVVLFLLETGMRIGEFCGLTVADFDFTTDRLLSSVS